jgi:hypothetical protein
MPFGFFSDLESLGQEIFEESRWGVLELGPYYEGVGAVSLCPV